MLQNMYASRFVLLAGYVSIWLMDRYLLEQVGGFKNVIFTKKEGVTISSLHHENYFGPLSTPAKVNVHFAARFYT